MPSIIATISLLTFLASSAVHALPQGNFPGEGVETVAAHVVAHNNPISNGTNTSQSFNLTLPFGYLTLYTAQQATCLSLVSVTSRVPGVTVDPAAAVCRRYLDPYGQQPGSEPFSLGKDAFVSTNPVDVMYILCYTVRGATVDPH